jgi:hypothetical protein
MIHGSVTLEDKALEPKVKRIKENKIRDMVSYSMWHNLHLQGLRIIFLVILSTVNTLPDS